MIDKSTDGLGNTRPERRQESGIRLLIDWVSVAFHLQGDWDDVKDLVGLSNLDFEYFEWGNDTYQEHIRFSHLKIQRKNDTQYQLQFSGQACREFESLSRITWFDLFGIITDFTTCNFTRIDLAIDDFFGHYDVNKIRKTVNEKRVVTRMQFFEDRKKVRVSDLVPVMDSVYFGSINSRLSINIYDKKLERESANKVVDGDFWTRTELSIKREYANQVVDMILLHDFDVGKVAFGVLKKNIRFVRRSKAVNKREVKMVKWWADFVGDVEKVQFSLEAPDRTIDKAKDWMMHTVAPSFAMMQEADPAGFQKFITELLENGSERLNEKHGMMISQHKALEFERSKEKIKEINSEISENPNIQQKILKKIQRKNAQSL